MKPRETTDIGNFSLLICDTEMEIKTKLQIQGYMYRNSFTKVLA
jgi:hypothetical protein